MDKFVVLLFSIALLVVADPVPTPAQTDIQAYRFSPCRFWQPSPSGGFVCQNIPADVLLPDARSVVEVMREQSDRIARLEKKVSELESECKK